MMSARPTPDHAAIVAILTAIERWLRRRRLGEAARKVALVVAELQGEGQDVA